MGAALSAVLDPIIEEVFAQARADGRREPHAANAADAMAELARRAAGTSRGGDGGEDRGGGTVVPAASPARPRVATTKILVRVDLEALLRGYPTSGETCEIVGFGPVAVSAIRDMIDTGDPFLAAVATRGVQVLGVAHLGRRPIASQQTALEWLYPRCANEACPNLAGLEYDHRDDWAKTHVTLFDSLDRFCKGDHRKKSTENWSLVEGRGRRAFVPPDDPRHPRNTAAGAQRPPPASSKDPPEAA